MIESWLAKLNNKFQNIWLRILIQSVFLFFVIGGVIALIGDLGFGAEIQKYRSQIWLGLAGIIVLSVGAYEISQRLKLLSSAEKEIVELNTLLNDASQRENSLLRLMESYKNAATTEVFENFYRLLQLVSIKHKLATNGTKITKIYVRENSAVQQIDAAYASQDSLEIVINVGSNFDIQKGMQFVVSDPNVPIDFGLIAVQKTHTDGAICTLVEIAESSFWRDALDMSTNGQTGIIKVNDNILSPFLPPLLQTMSEENAQQLCELVRSVLDQEHSRGAIL